MEGRLERPSDILTVKEAIDLINSDTPKHPVVDNKQLIKNVEFLKANFRGGGMNYTIFLKKYDKNGELVPNGVKFVAVNNKREQMDLEYAITDHYKKVSGGVEVDPDSIGLVQQTTVIDKRAGGGNSNQPRRNKDGKMKFGDELRGGTESVTAKEG